MVVCPALCSVWLATTLPIILAKVKVILPAPLPISMFSTSLAGLGYMLILFLATSLFVSKRLGGMGLQVGQLTWKIIPGYWYCSYGSAVHTQLGIY